MDDGVGEKAAARRITENKRNAMGLLRENNLRSLGSIPNGRNVIGLFLCKDRKAQN
jgi:hypothetical protein